MEGGQMIKSQKKKDNREHSLGELIVVLFEEARKISPKPLDQKVMVYAALRDLIGENKVFSKHPIALQA
jgi:hypothetical protein